MADLFGSTAGDWQGWRSGGEFITALIGGMVDPRFQNSTMTEGVGADGGFTVPSALTTQLMDAALEMELVRPYAQVYPMDTNNLTIATVDTQDRSANVGGLIGHWMAENAANTPQKAVFRTTTLVAKKLAIFTQASSEVTADGMNFERVLTTAMVNALQYDLDKAFIEGTGTGQPTGALNSASLISVGKDSGQAADTLSFTNIVSMWSRMHPSCHRNAVWLANPGHHQPAVSIAMVGHINHRPCIHAAVWCSRRTDCHVDGTSADLHREGSAAGR